MRFEYSKETEIFAIRKPSRVVMFNEEINSETATKLIQTLLKLSMDNPDEPIYLLINSPGGSVKDGFAILDTMMSLSAEIYTLGMGEVSSMASLMLAAGDKRYVQPSASGLIHSPYFSRRGRGEDFINSYLDSRVTNERFNAFHMTLLDKTEEEITEMLRVETYLTADDFIEKGYADYKALSIMSYDEFKELKEEKDRELLAKAKKYGIKEKEE